jgi:hypothetical protein
VGKFDLALTISLMLAAFPKKKKVKTLRPGVLYHELTAFSKIP